MAEALFVLAEKWDPVRMAGRVATGALGLPLPVPIPGRRAPKDRGTGLPETFVLRVTAERGEVVDAESGAVVEAFERGRVVARVREAGGASLVLELRWSDAQRFGTIAGAATPEAREVVEWLLHHARVAGGADPVADAAFVELLLAMPEELLEDRRDALRSVSALLRAGDEPRLLLGGDQGISIGAVLITDTSLMWWSGGRREPLSLPIASIVTVGRDGEQLRIRDTAGRTHLIEELRPKGSAELLEARLRPAPRDLDRLDELARDIDDGDLTMTLGLVRETLADGETPLGLGRATSGGLRTGTVVVTDRRLLWVHPKRTIAIDRADLEEVTASKGMLTFTAGGVDHHWGWLTPEDGLDAFASALSGD